MNISFPVDILYNLPIDTTAVIIEGINTDIEVSHKVEGLNPKGIKEPINYFVQK